MLGHFVVMPGGGSWDAIPHEEFKLVADKPRPILFGNDLHRTIKQAHLTDKWSLRSMGMVTPRRGFLVPENGNLGIVRLRKTLLHGFMGAFIGNNPDHRCRA